MKIYSGQHKIVQTSQVNTDFDIPLAYINAATVDYNTIVAAEPGFDTSVLKEVIPYEVFDSMNVSLFDKDGNKINNAYVLQRNSQDKYQYIPQNAISFQPQRFNYTVVGKKSMSYKTTSYYNIQAGCVDDPETLFFAKNLIKVFGDAPARKICPVNISVNNQDLSIQSLTNSSIGENDFVFIQSENGTKYKGSTELIDIDAYLNKHTNVWLSVDNFLQTPLKSTDAKVKYVLSKNYVVNMQDFETAYYFELPGQLSTSTIEYHNLFTDPAKTPILIMEHPKKGFVIVTHKSFLDNVTANVNMFYETMMYVYMNTYLESQKINEWIADYMPDHIVLNNRLTKKEKFTSNMELHKMFGLTREEIVMSDIKIDAPNIMFAGIASDYIVFRKNSTGPNAIYADPVKPEGNIAIFTPRQDIIFYDKFIYKVSDAIKDKISTQKVGEKIQVNIKPFKHSDKNIHVTLETLIEIPLIKTENYKEIKLQRVNMCLVCKDNVLKLVEDRKRTADDGVFIATIIIEQTSGDIGVMDMRQRGGGLAESEQPRFDLFDIGNILGRPYRKAGTVIISVPARLKPYEKIIMEAVKKHMPAEELPIIIFE